MEAGGGGPRAKGVDVAYALTPQAADLDPPGDALTVDIAQPPKEAEAQRSWRRSGTPCAVSPFVDQRLAGVQL
jgi:hypothetical protein